MERIRQLPEPNKVNDPSELANRIISEASEYPTTEQLAHHIYSLCLEFLSERVPISEDVVSWFNTWNCFGLPELPELPKLPELPELPESERLNPNDCFIKTVVMLLEEEPGFRDKYPKLLETCFNIRSEFRERIIEHQLEATRRLSDLLNPKEKGKAPITVMLRGNTATGKTRIFREKPSDDDESFPNHIRRSFTNHIRTLYSEGHLRRIISRGILNPDTIKAFLRIGRDDVFDQIHLNEHLTSFQVHLEGSKLTKKVKGQLGDLSYIIDKRHLDRESIRDEFKKCLEAGRRLHVVDVDGSLRNSLLGVLERSPGGEDPIVVPGPIIGGYFQAKFERKRIIEMIEKEWSILTDEQKNSFEFSYEIYLELGGKKVLAASFDRKKGKFEFYSDKATRKPLMSSEPEFTQAEKQFADKYLEYFDHRGKVSDENDLKFRESVEGDSEINPILDEQLIDEYCTKFTEDEVRQMFKNRLMKFKGLSLFRALDLHAEGDREGSIVARIQHELNNATGKGN